MELKHKERKIRDMFIYNTGIIPVEVSIKRHEIIIVVKKADLNKQWLTEDGAVMTIAQITGRKITLHTTNEEE